MLNRSRARDVDDTRMNYEELDSAITSGLYIKDEMNRAGEDFYYHRRYWQTFRQIFRQGFPNTQKEVVGAKRKTAATRMVEPFFDGPSDWT